MGDQRENGRFIIKTATKGFTVLSTDILLVRFKLANSNFVVIGYGLKNTHVSTFLQIKSIQGKSNSNIPEIRYSYTCSSLASIMENLAGESR